MRLDTCSGNITFTGNVLLTNSNGDMRFNDNVRLRFGTSEDSNIRFNGTDTIFNHRTVKLGSRKGERPENSGPMLIMTCLLLTG